MSAASSAAGVLGAGAWGTTLANVLAENGADVALWCHSPDLARAMTRERENQSYLAGIPLHPSVEPTADLQAVVAGKRVVVSAVPSHVTREVAERASRSLDGAALIVSATKGIENETLRRMSEVFAEILGDGGAAHPRVAVLSGPSFAREVSEHQPTAVTMAGPSEETAREARDWFVRPYFRIYTSTDVVGVELGGALKNVMAIAAGVAEGLETGMNGRAALITRGMAEIMRLGQVLGAQPLTLSGLAGMGDLVLTCTSLQSRNYGVGVRLGKGTSVEAILGEMREVAEGVRTARSVYDIARRYDVEMPIVNEVYAILYKGKSPASALADLMGREVKAEFWR